MRGAEPMLSMDTRCRVRGSSFVPRIFMVLDIVCFRVRDAVYCVAAPCYIPIFFVGD